jgi:hypothetical protein
MKHLGFLPGSWAISLGFPRPGARTLDVEERK